MDSGGDDGLDVVRGGPWGQWGFLLGVGMGYLGRTRLLPSLTLSHLRRGCHDNRLPFTDPL